MKCLLNFLCWRYVANFAENFPPLSIPIQWNPIFDPNINLISPIRMSPKWWWQKLIVPYATVAIVVAKRRHHPIITVYMLSLSPVRRAQQKEEMTIYYFLLHHIWLSKWVLSILFQSKMWTPVIQPPKRVKRKKSAENPLKSDRRRRRPAICFSHKSRILNPFPAHKQGARVTV